MSQIKEEQLKKLQDLVNKTNSGQILLGQLEVQKNDVISELLVVRSEFLEFQKELENEYGKVSVNIQDGTYTEIPENESDKKD